MEAQGGAGGPDPNKDIQKLLKPSSSGELSKEPSHHHPTGEEEGVILGHTPGLLHVTERRLCKSDVCISKPSEEAPGEGGPQSFLCPALLQTEPLSSVSSLEVHFDLLDLTELTDMSDQELTEVFADSDEENHNDSPASHHHHPLPLHRSGYMRSPSWTRCSKSEQTRDRKHHSDSDTTDPHRKPERPKQP